MNSSKETIQRHGVIGLAYPQILAIIFAIGGLMSLGWLDNSRGPIYPLIIADLNLTHSQGSAFFAFASFTSVVANFSVPYLLRILGPKKLLFMGVVVLSFFPLALNITENYGMLLVSAVIFGWALGTIMVALNLVVEESVPASKKRFFLSLMHSTFGLSALLAPILIGLILGSGIGWEQSFLFILLFILPTLIIGFASIRAAAKAPAGLFTSRHTHIISKNLKVHLNKKILIFWGFILAGYVSTELFFTTRLVVLFKEAFGLDLAEANFKLVCFFVGLFLGRIIVSFMPTKFSGRSMLVLSFLLTSLWILMCYFFWPDYIWLAGFWMSPIYPISMDEISNQTTHEFGRYSSLIIAFGSMGVVVMHMVVGYIFDNFGMMIATLLPFILCLFCTFMCLFFWPTSKSIGPAAGN